MAYSVIYANGDGSTKTFPISYPLGFISRSDVTCRVGEEVDGTGTPVFRNLTWITDGLVTLSGYPPPVGVNNVKFYRTVSKTELVHDYANGVAIEEVNLDESNKQLLMALHEFMDGRNAPIRLDSMDMNSHKIVNLAPGTDNSDAVTVLQAAQAIALTPVAVQAASDAAAALIAAEIAQADAEAAAASALVAAEAAQADAEAVAASAAGTLVSAMLKAQNLNDVADKATARTNLDVYDKASVYTKTEAYAKSEVYTKTEAYAKSEVYTKAEVNAALAAIPKTPSGKQLFISSGTFTVPSGVDTMWLSGSGGGGGGGGTYSGGNGGAGGSTSFGSLLSLSGGGGGFAALNGPVITGGSFGGGHGSVTRSNSTTFVNVGGNGGGQQGGLGGVNNGSGASAPANSGSGGGGAATAGLYRGSGGGGAGQTKLPTDSAVTEGSSYNVTIGAGGSGGTIDGGAGGSGWLLVEW